MGCCGLVAWICCIGLRIRCCKSNGWSWSISESMIWLKLTFDRILRFAAITVLAITVLVGCFITNMFTLPVPKDVPIHHLPRLSIDHVTNRTCQPLLCLFTTFKPGGYKIPVTYYKRCFRYACTVYSPTLREQTVAAENAYRVHMHLAFEHIWNRKCHLSSL